MTKTPNYDLNQWDPEDKVIRTDFNEDNAKIDAALHTLEQDKAAASAVAALQSAVDDSPYVRLAGLTVTAPTSQIDLDLSAYDMSQFQKLELHIVGQTTGSTCSACVMLNGHYGDYYQHKSGSSTTTGGISYLVSATMNENPGGSHITIYLLSSTIMSTGYNVRWDNSTISFTYGWLHSIRSSVVAAEDLHTINLVTADGGNFPTGMRVSLMGLRY